MAHFLRVVAALCAFAFAVVCSAPAAAYPAPSVIQYKADDVWYPGEDGWRIACINFVASRPGDWGAIMDTSGPTVCKYHTPPFPGWGQSQQQIISSYVYACPDGGNLSTPANTCTCVAPNIENSAHTACFTLSACPSVDAIKTALGTAVVDNVSQAGATGISKAAASGKAAQCAGGCTVQFQNAACGGIGDKWSCELSAGAATAKPCEGSGFGVVDTAGTFTQVTPAPSTSTTTATTVNSPVGHAPGTCPGTVNGIEVWLPCSSTVEAAGTPTTTTTTTASGTAVTTVDKTTVCANGVCTTTTTGTVTTTVTGTASNGQGGTGTVVTSTTTTPVSKTETQDQPSFCKANPDLSICKQTEKSTFGGACKAFSCSGDAAMCAIAKSAADTKCQLDASAATVEIAAYEATKVAGTTTGIQSTIVAISPSSFDTSNALGAGASCISDLTVTVSHKTVTLPLSSVCEHLALLGQLLLAISFLAAVAIVGKPS